MQQYFKPRSSYEPERVDYNCLNIFAEFQSYNLEFCKNDIYLNDKQSANVLDFFWKMLEFDPDQPSILEGNQTSETETIKFTDNQTADERALGQLLKSKVELMKNLLD